MSEITEPLRRLGFAEYEAKAYVSLLRRSPLSGYELAKVSGVPRADIYAVLQKLEERGAVLRLDLEAGTRYAAVPAEGVIQRLQARFQETVAVASRSLEEVSAAPEHEYVWNARGYPVLIEHARALLNAAQRHLLIALSLPEAQALAEDLARAEQRQVEITTLCLDACPNECGCCRGRINRKPVGSRPAARWLVLVADQHELLAGEIGGDGDAMAVRTRQPLLVGMASRYILYNIALAMVVEDLGEDIARLLRPETSAALSSLEIGSLRRLKGKTKIPGNPNPTA